MKKRCIKCGVHKESGEKCPNCALIRSTKYKRSIKGVLHIRYRSLVYRSQKRGWPAPNFDKQHFYNTFSRDKIFLKVYTLWASANYSKGLAPSVDRIDPTLPYQLGNIRFVSWQENAAKGQYLDHKNLDAMQLSLLREQPERLKDPDNVDNFKIKGLYSYEIGGFLLTPRQFTQVCYTHEKEDILELCRALEIPLRMAQVFAVTTVNRRVKSVGFYWGVMHPNKGFMKKD